MGDGNHHGSQPKIGLERVLLSKDPLYQTINRSTVFKDTCLSSLGVCSSLNYSVWIYTLSTMWHLFYKKNFRKSDTSITNSPLKKWKTVFTQRNNHKWLFIFSVDNHEEKNLKGTLLAVPNATVPTLVQVFCYSQILGFIQSIL